MVLRSQPAYISLTARRAQPAGPPPTQPTTPTHTERKMREIQHPHLTDGSPYQVRVASGGQRPDRARRPVLARAGVGRARRSRPDRGGWLAFHQPAWGPPLGALTARAQARRPSAT